MKQVIFLVNILIIALLDCLSLQAQDKEKVVQPIIIELKDLAVIDIESQRNITLNVRPPLNSEAGLSLRDSHKNSSLWLNYTVVKSSPSDSKKIEVKIGRILKGIKVFLEVGEATGTSAGGELGTSVGKIELSTTPQTIIQGIGSAHTGNGIGKGHQLIYNLEVDKSNPNYTNISSGKKRVRVTYTISDD